MDPFKTYDIRGKWGQGVNNDLAYLVGRAYSQFQKGKRYIVGHDARLHSKELYHQVIQGMVDEGREVIAVGLVSTPCLHFLQMNKAFDGAIMVTASHNPPEYHGFKLFDNAGGSISRDKGLLKIEELCNTLNTSEKQGNGFVHEDPSLIDDYIDFLVDVNQTMHYSGKLIIDGANGSGGLIFEKLAQRLHWEAKILNLEPDGNFPNHGPNPLESDSQKQIGQAMVQEQAQFGAILDGDGDRVIFIDEKGQAIPNYFASVLIAQSLLEQKAGSAIVYDLISSRVLPTKIEELGGKAVVSKVGYTFLYDAMVQNKAVFGTETSGHVYFKVTDNFYTESAAYAVILLTHLLEKYKKPISQLIAPLTKIFCQAPETNLEVDDKDGAMARVEAHYQKLGAMISHLDGVSVDTKDYWFNLRPSNTEPLLRLRLEGTSQEVVDREMENLLKLIQG